MFITAFIHIIMGKSRSFIRIMQAETSAYKLMPQKRVVLYIPGYTYLSVRIAANMKTKFNIIIGIQTNFFIISPGYELGMRN